MKISELIEILNYIIIQEGDCEIVVDAPELDYFREIDDVCGKYYIGNINDGNGHRLNRVFIVLENAQI